MLTWTTPETNQVFDGVCPWCGATTQPAQIGVSYAQRCACGAFALGAPARDRDEVIDDAIDELRLVPPQVANLFHEPRRWLEPLGIDYREGGKVGERPTIYYYWFKRVRP
jgi:hypothetical protein